MLIQRWLLCVSVPVWPLPTKAGCWRRAPQVILIAIISDDPNCGSPGLQLSASELSLPLGVSGAALMMWSLLVFPSVVKRLGARACALLGLYVSVLVPVALGSVSFLAAAHVPRRGILAALVVVQIVKACFQQLCFPTAMVRPPQPASPLPHPS